MRTCLDRNCYNITMFYTLGSETLTVEMPYQENFTIKIYIGIDSPEDIAQKISSRVTEVTAPYMTLFIRLIAFNFYFNSQSLNVKLTFI